jgi:predicted RNase H-like HicB family nuclease
MQFSIAIHKEHGTAYGVTVPDIPGCHSWGESIDDAIRNVEDMQAPSGHSLSSI